MFGEFAKVPDYISGSHHPFPSPPRAPPSQPTKPTCSFNLTHTIPLLPPRHLTLFEMSPKKIHGTRSVTQRKALDSLNDAIRMICPFSEHKIKIAQLNFSEKFEGYHVRLECGHITWTIQMWENCSFRKITRSWRHAMAVANFVSQTSTGTSNHLTYHPLPFRSFQCPSSTESSEDEGSDPSSQEGSDLEDETEYNIEETIGEEGDEIQTSSQVGDGLEDETTDEECDETQTTSQAGSDPEEEIEYDIEEETMDEEGDETQD
ncbi:hypothetical protein HOY82DRAFT_534849 [Tuber indicum]|nr:hypothetical protein HOY82DRAFT_534849 [Tuber indicum]